MNARRRRRNRKHLSMPEVSLTPLIDTALTLLLIFMVTAPMVHNSINVSLPAGQTKEGSAVEDIVVSMTSEGQLYLGSEPVERQQLMTTLGTTLQSSPEIPVSLRADEGLSYGAIISLVDDLKRTGVRRVALSTRVKQ